MSTNASHYEEKNGIFIKSIPEHGLGLNWVDHSWNRIIVQTTDNIFETLELRPNTDSFGLDRRICFSYLFDQAMYPKFKDSYRNAGIVFTYRDGDKQDYFFPCDLLALTCLQELPKNKSQLFANIQSYYRAKMMKDWQLFGAEDINEWMQRIMSRFVIWGSHEKYEDIIVEMINEFRNYAWYNPISCLDHNWLVSHNECIKFTPLKIDIFGVVGNNKLLNETASKHHIRTYSTVTQLMENL